MKWGGGGIKRTYREHRNNPEGGRKVDDPPDGGKGKLDGVIENVPPDKGCKVLGGELTYK